MPHNQADILRAINELKDSIANLNFRLSEQNKKINKLENEFFKQDNKAGLAPPSPPPLPNVFEKSSDKTLNSLVDKVENVLSADKHNVKAEVDEYAKKQESKKHSSQSLEERIGSKWFLKIGIIVLVLGISFFLKYTFDNDWIGPTARVVIGILSGLALLGLGEKTIRKYNLYGQILSGGGIVALYMSVFAALNFYDLIGYGAAFLFMVMVTIIGVALSVRYNAPPLIITAVLGGFATPFLVSSGENQQFALFSYIILLDLSILAVSYFKKWHWLHLIGFVGTIFTFMAWHGEYYTSDQLFATFSFLSIFFIIYSISALIYNLATREKSSGIEQIITLVSGIVYFLVSYGLLEKDYDYLLGFFVMILAIYYFLWAHLVKSFTPKDENLYNFLAFLSISFITIAAPLQFDFFVITICWAIEAALLFYIGGRSGTMQGDIIKTFAFIVYGLALIRFFVFDYTDYAISDLLFLNKAALSAVFLIVSFYVGSYISKRSVKSESGIFKRREIAKLFIVLASLCTIFAVSRDIHTYRENIIDKEINRIQEYNQEIKKEYQNSNEYLKRIDGVFVNTVREGKWTMISIFCSIYGLVLMVIGTLKKRGYLLSLGAVFNFLVAARFFAHDLWNYKTVCRQILALEIISALYLGAGLLYEYLKNSGNDNKFLNIKKTVILFLITANILTIFAGSRELWLHYNDKVLELKTERNKVCAMQRYTKPTNSAYDKIKCRELDAKINRAENKASVSISLFWLVYAILLIILGFWKRCGWARIGGMSLLSVAILKLFFYDLWSLGQLYRIIASISLGMVLLGISFLYQKYKHVFKDIIND
ncbi:MAG: DUF2339 domain-containing protein [Patescibacteria group bacterium]|nr:DUF2339 domain-containing protein [Patescibacteria group bacterium]